MSTGAPDGTPADAYSRFREQQGTPEFAEFAAGYGFALDPYQREACGHVEAGSGVLVAAPTGAGKTVVGEFAVFLALRRGRKCFYTTPIKALSNQKYLDLVRRHGPQQVGLLTGDSTINSEAPVVVMTTEVLRNMIYAGSPTLTGLGFVVMDEVHYLADRFRGAVWEEVIIGLADSVQVVALSATVSNAEEFGEWLGEVRGAMGVVVSERRPVPLFQHVLVGNRLYDLFAGVAPTAAEAAGAAPPEVNPALLKVARDESRLVRDDARRPRGRRVGADGRRTGAGRPRSTDRISRPDLVEDLDQAALLPAIVFVFSRAGCDAAVRQLLAAGAVLTQPYERAAIDAIVERHVGGLSAADLRALDFAGFHEALGRGIAAHHAGLLPAFKECVEEAFAQGHVKVVFATETLALGINMPARSVVLESLVKYNGESHADITPGEYTQLTGRAGRRGIDVEGHAVVVWRPGLDPRVVAGLASRRTYPLRSSFSPTYNMAVNLVGAVGRERARTLLELSFAQFQSDRSVVGSARTVARNERQAAELLAAARCDRGDFTAYARLRAAVAAAEAEQARERQQTRRSDAEEALLHLTPGDVIRVPSGRSQGFAVVLQPARADRDGRHGGGHGGGHGAGRGDRRRDAPRPQVLTEDRQVRRLSLVDFPVPAVVVGRVKVPKHFDSGDAGARRGLASALRALLDGLPADQVHHRAAPVVMPGAARIEELRRELRAHPCHSCPDREQHARHAERALHLERENERIAERMRDRTSTIAQHFERICDVLESLGYLSADATVTDDGRMLARLYGELDLVTAECIRHGALSGLTPPQLAAVLAALVFEARRVDDRVRRPRMPDQASSHAMELVRRIWREVSILERDARLPRGAEPDIGFSEAAYAWAAGRPLATVLADRGMPAGDFVRWTRQVIDLAGQVADAVGPGLLRDTARLVVRSMRRGIVDVAPAEVAPAEDGD